MSLSTILAAKDLSLTYQPLLLAQVTFADGTILRLATVDLRSATTGLQYGGHDWLPQILNQDIAAKQALSQEGIDAVPNVTLQLADADRFLWTNYEQAKGFKGSDCQLIFVFYDLTTGTFSSDSMVIFRGICDPPNMDEATMSIKAVSKMSMTRANLPTTRIQRLDPHPFPNTLADRTAALNDPSSPFYACGYSADVAGGFGNLNAGVAYTAADYDGTYESYLKVLGSGSGTAATGTCNLNPSAPHQVTGINITSPGAGYLSAPSVVIAGNGTGATATATVSSGIVTGVNMVTHGSGYTIATVTFSGGLGGNDLTHDSSGRPTGTFGGVRWVPPNTFRGKSYAEGKTVSGSNAINQNLYQDFVPMIYGTGLVQPVVVSVLGDANSTRGEAILCQDQITGIYNSQLVVNNVNVSLYSTDPLNRYGLVNDGNRHGNVNRDAIFNGAGDCYGSMAVAEWVVYNQIASSSSVPDIWAIVQGPQIRVYSNPSTYLTQYSENPAWVLLDLLVKSGAWTYADVDIATFISAAAICDRAINYTATDGTTQSHSLFKTSLVIRQRKAASDYIKGLRTSFRATLVPNSANNGLLQLSVDGTLADQQPAPISGSNYNTAVSSVNYAGTATNGYVAYKFTDTNGTILRENGKSSLRITQAPVLQTPNALAFSFQDSENGYQQDQITISDSVDISRVAQQVNTSFAVDGINTFDQAQRIGAWWLGKTLRGNPRGDSGGTLHFTWKTNFKGLHLQVGQIVMMTSAHDNITGALVRLTSVQPSANLETITLEGDYHVDEFYLDAYGQSGFMSLSNPSRGRLDRPPYPWLPNEIAPVNTSDPLFSQTNFTFNVAQDYKLDANGNPIAQLLIRGKVPVNQFSTTIQTPLVRSTYTVASTGGTLKSGLVYSMCVCGVDGDGFYTGPSALVNAPIAAGTSTNTITLTDLTWFSGTAGYALFAGTDPNSMCFQSAVSGTPSTIELSALNDRSWGVPDPETDRLRARIKRVRHDGTIGDPLSGVTTSTMTIAGQTWTTNQWAGRIVTVVGDPSNLNDVLVLNYTIISNTADTLTVSGNPSRDGVSTDDVIIIRTLATTFSSNTIGDANFINDTALTGLDTDAEAGNTVRIIGGTGIGQTFTIASNDSTTLTINGTWDIEPDATSIFIIEEPTWLEDFTTTHINNPDPTNDIIVPLRIDNFLNQTLLVEVSTVDGLGRFSLDTKNAWREVYVFGSLGTGVLTTAPLDWQGALDALPQDSY